MDLPEDLVIHHVDIALAEDLRERGDLSTEAVVPEDRMASARIVAKADGVLAGMALALATFRKLDSDVRFPVAEKDGKRVSAGDWILRVEGRAHALLAGERTALNFLQQLSGVATLTSLYVDELRGTGAVVLETRKTTPGLRHLQKYAVRIGGGENHRFGLFDRILLKENHFALSGNGMDVVGYRKTVEQAVQFGGKFGPVAVEVRDLGEAEAAVDGGADILLLDNFESDELPGVVRAIREHCRKGGRDILLEASGGITLETISRFATAGIDRVSVGALTHSAPALDMSLLMDEVSAQEAQS